MSEGIPESLTVSELTCYLKGIVEEAVPSVWVEGEISNLSKPRSGHVYFTLKDDQAQIRGVIWRTTAAKLRFELKEGQHVLALGGVEVYGPQGVYQLIIRKLEPQGMGALQLAFQQLQARLQAEGLFDPSRKKRLPAFPRRIGVVTSPTGAAVRDFLEIALRRWPTLDVTIVPAKVQGTGAAQSIAAAIKAANLIKPSLDLLVITRGGGSMEDLWCFNEETVVRAIAASRLPTVSAVGHEIDVTLADFAADLRALTPSEAAERIVPELAVWTETVRRLGARLRQPVYQRIQFHQEQLRQIQQRASLRKPHEVVHRLSQRLDELDARGCSIIRQMHNHRVSEVQLLASKLEALSPLNVLARGYSLSTRADNNELIASIAHAHEGDLVNVQLRDGRLRTRVVDVHPNTVGDR